MKFSIMTSSCVAINILLFSFLGSCVALVSTMPKIAMKSSTSNTQAVHMTTTPKDGEQETTKTWDADLYQESHNFVWKYGSSVVDLLDPKPGEYILDVGCGTGELTNEIAHRVFATSQSSVEEGEGAVGVVFGMDADANMIQRAQSCFDKVIFFQGNASNFSLPSTADHRSCESTLTTKVDAIFSNAALHWVTDAKAAVASMASVLKPGGRFVVEFGGYGNVNQIVEAANKVLNRSLDNNPWFFPTIGEYSTLLEKHGIDVTNAALFDRPTELDGGIDGMKNWLQMFGGVLLDESSSSSSEAEKNDHVIEDIVELLRPLLYNGQTWIADYRRLRIVGKKRM